MEALFVNRLIPPSCTNFHMRWHSTDGMSLFHQISLPMRANKQRGHPRIIMSSKRSMFQDFQDFAKPLRLLPASEANINTNYISEEIPSSLDLDPCNSFYMVELRTSRDFGSGISEVNAGILLCLIDIDGDSILQRISAASCKHRGPREAIDSSESIYFQSGSVDTVIFEGSKLKKVEALWIGLESGSWRLDGVRLTVIDGPASSSKSTEIKGQLDGLQYVFEVNNILLGEGEGVSVAELRPTVVTELSTDNLANLLTWNTFTPALFSSHNTSNEEGMREYSDLKFSLLLYDLLLVFVGSTVLTFSFGGNVAYSFLIGGIGGFLYLLLLQRSVDGLSAESPATDDATGNFMRELGGFKGPLLSLSLALATSVITVKYGITGSSVPLTPADLIAGVTGFLACKIAVVLAAFKPIKRSP